MRPPFLLSIVALASLGAARADQPTPAATGSDWVQIPFVHQGGIYDWKAEGTGAILIESLQHKYYRATFAVPCEKLPYTENVGFETDPDDTLTKFDSIFVGHEHCYFQSFSEIPKPPGFPH